MRGKIKKVLLIAPPTFTFKSQRDVNPLPPMGLGYLASVVESMGIEVKIVDCLVRGWNHEEEINNEIIRVGLSDNDIETLIGDFDPDVVGINCQFSRQHRIYHHMFSLVKKVKPACITIAGGAHVTVCPEEVLNDHSCDFVLAGEAEESFREFLLAITQGSGLDQVDGLGWKSNGKLIFNKKQKWITDLDSIPFPAYHLMELDRYFGLEASHGARHRKNFCPIITSRGCPAKCTFCSAHRVWGKKYRLRSVDNILKEMKLLKDQYGIEELMFEDDNVTANPKRAMELFSGMIEKKFNFIWDTPNGVGVWSINEKMLGLMKQSGCIKLNFPFESGSQYVLDNIIKKPLKLAKIKYLIECCKKMNLDYGMFAVIGMPGETIEDMWKTFRFAADCGCYTPHISVATPYPGTELFEICSTNQYLSKEFHLDDLFIRSFMIRTSDWTENELRKTLLKGHLYLNFRALFNNPIFQFKRLIKKLKHPNSIIDYIKRIMQWRV